MKKNNPIYVFYDKTIPEELYFKDEEAEQICSINILTNNKLLIFYIVNVVIYYC